MNESVTWKQVLNQLVQQQDLSAEQVAWAMDQLMTGQTPEAIAGAFLLGLHVKGESSGELAALAQGMLQKATPLQVNRQALDLVGTGGDQHNTVNISTMASLLAAGAGAPVVKHGNRASSSMTGSADVLQELGINLNMKVNDLASCLEEVGISFLFAQVFHPAVRHIAPIRKSLAVPTAFNFLGPMTNPARVKSSAVGVARSDMAEKMAQVFAARGDHALILRGSDGLDELTITGPSHIWEAWDGGVKEHSFDPASYGFSYASLDELRGGDAKHNAQVVVKVLQGRPGPILDAVLINAAAGLLAYSPLNPDLDFKDRFAQALEKARQSLESGSAQSVLDRWIDFSQRV